jgi:hypothetical protein
LDEDAILTREEVEFSARRIGPYYRLSMYLQAGAGLRVSEALAFATQWPPGRGYPVRSM